MNKQRRLIERRLPLAIAAALLLGGCAVGPDYETPATPLPKQFSKLAPASAETVGYVDAAPIAQFWRLFDDAMLNRLVEQALDTNHDIRIAAANLEAARAIRGGAIADLFPAVGIETRRDKSRLSADETATGTVQRSTLNRGGVDMAWELDLFGRVRRNVEASSASAQAFAEELRAARVSVSAEVATNYMELRGVQEQFAVAKRNADNQRETLKIVEAREQAGRGTEFDTQRARAQLNSTLAQLPALQAQVELRMHRLSVLLGQSPTLLDEMLRPVEALPALPRLVQIGKPEQLLRRRPDVRAAERRLATATANIGVAEADWFPRVSFTGEIGFAAASGGRIGDGDTATYRYGPGISWSILDFGHLRARVAQSKAEEKGALASYEQTVLRALEETEDALSQYGATRQRLDYLQASVDANARAEALAQLRVENGSAEFLDVLDVPRARLDVDASLSQSRTAAATGLIAVYKALGGGWQADADVVAASNAATDAD